MSARYIAVMLMVSVVAASLFAGPKIEFDTKTFQCGEVLAGKVDKINAVFVVKNIGNATLKLTGVRPGCGCTVVKYDSLIEPGKTAKIEATVNIGNTSAGQKIAKYITVTSNADNEPSVRIGIEANVIAIIEVSETLLNLNSSDSAKLKTITLASRKKDLKVTAVVFNLPVTPDVQEWQKDFPIPIKYTWIATDSMRADKYYVFKLGLYAPLLDRVISRGETVITTNHPDKPEVRVPTDIGK